jgi:mRNA-degrading endonuclease RelE of RelBE toxin-antitoxin system
VHDVQLGSKANRDLRKIKDDRARRDVARFLKDELTADPHPDNVDIVPLSGKAPWMRGRSGEHRVIFRPLTADEVQEGFKTGYLVARIVDRKELQKAVKALSG